MTWSRREVLATLGMASANAILFACGAPPRGVQHAAEIDPEIRTWLRDAVGALVGAGFTAPHALAVSRRRTTAALDVLGAGVARGRCDGVVLSVRDKTGVLREQMTNDLSREGVLAAVRSLTGNPKLTIASVEFGPVPAAAIAPPPDPDALTDAEMLARVGALAARDKALSSRIVYAASVLDVDDARVWSVAPGRMLEQRLVRVRKTLTRVAWHGSRPFVSEAARAWTGGIDALDLTDEEIVATRENALALLTPSAFEDGETGFLLEPGVAAALVDAGVRTLLTSDAQRRPEVVQRLATAKTVAANITLVDDPTVSDAYGGFRFDDAGMPAAAVTLIDRGTIVGRVERGMRPGHIGADEIAPSHIRLSGGTVAASSLLDKGFVLEGHTSTLVDPSSDRFVIQVARAREQLAGRRTGRMYADIELVGELTQLFGSLQDLSQETRSIGIRDEVDGQPRHRSIDTPWLVGRGALRQRRRPT